MYNNMMIMIIIIHSFRCKNFPHSPFLTHAQIVASAAVVAVAVVVVVPLPPSPNARIIKF